MVSRRRVLAGEYTVAFTGISGLIQPSDSPNGTTNYQSFGVILTEGYRNGAQRPHGSASGRWDLESAWRHGLASRAGLRRHPTRPLPNTEIVADRSIILPMYHQMTSGDLERVASVVRAGALG